MRNEGLQTDTFTTAGFVLTSPVDVPAAAFDGEVVDVTLHGDLTLHGVTKTVDIPAQAQVAGDQIQVQGSISSRSATSTSSRRTSAGSSCRSRTTARWNSS